MLIEIFSDVVCPWCFIGKRRLDMVMNTSVGDGVELLWRPYQLNPNMPVAGIPRENLLRARHPEVENLEALKQKVPGRIRAEAENVGLELNYGAMEVMPNTLMAHRLLSFAAAQQVSLAAGDVAPAGPTPASANLQHELAEVLFRYNFCDGRNVGDLEELVCAAVEVGLAADVVRDYLRSDAGVAELLEDLDRAVDLGVSGVPCFLLGGSFQLPGAQTPEVIGQFIQRAKARLG
jgi:predicted DsbA family dithiol-disulfide isomerase